MRNFYLFEQALQVGSVAALEEGLTNLNNIVTNRSVQRDRFLRNSTIWECNTTQGLIYELFGGIVNEELRRVIPYIFNSFEEHALVFSNHDEMDQSFPEDCNSFTGFEFRHTTVVAERRVYNTNTYNEFVVNCLKFGVIANENEMRINLQMMYPNLTFTERAVEESLYWKNTDLTSYKRLYDLFDDIPNNPFMGGIGQTEVLKYKNNVASKRVNGGDRMTYSLENGITTILACRGHYD